MEEKPFERIILIDKPENMSSFGVVARVRRKLRDEQEKKVKVGHTGTLDPFATGLMIILAGKATKKSDEFLKKDKEYEATVYLGKTSTTGDIEGEITDVSDKVPTLDEVKAACEKFVGEINQTVPIFSAVKINGERAYKLARKGKEIEMPTRKVTIFSIDILDYTYSELKIRTHVSSGTYIRTLGEDIGKALGTGAYLTALRRTKIANYDVSDALKLDDFMI